jgi:hypothetical protein
MLNKPLDTQRLVSLMDELLHEADQQSSSRVEALSPEHSRRARSSITSIRRSAVENSMFAGVGGGE